VTLCSPDDEDATASNIDSLFMEASLNSSKINRSMLSAAAYSSLPAPLYSLQLLTYKRRDINNNNRMMTIRVYP
jgi:hypothetical protein